MKHLFSFLTFCSILFTTTLAQQPLTYFLPDISYDQSIPTPEAFFGHQIGEWHLSHDKQYMYLRALAAASDRVELVEFARSYEDRPLIYLIITSEENLNNIDEIKAQHVKLSDPSQSTNLDVSTMPSVLYQGFSIHGNEPSGGNAAPLVAYYLAAGQGERVQTLLDNVVILLDPCYNPDGFNRFATWVNVHKNKNLTSDPEDREYSESWPRGRTNHYWFDLNRDWLPVQHPESQGRIQNFHEWKPNILTDHHEMGSNATFFFQPGIPQRTNPITPDRNQQLTAKIGTYHAAALDEIGSLYFTEERYDDYYYGKGSTYPDANGCIGILFEQASSRGHLQETDNGLLSFPFTIRNQVTTALSTITAAEDMREELLNYQRDFYKNGLSEATKGNLKGYVFSETNDRTRLLELMKILDQHQIEVYKLKQDRTINGNKFEATSSYVVPTNQIQYRTVRAIFDTTTTFKDSLFYDISAWTFPLAFNIAYEALDQGDFSNSMLGEQVTVSDLKSDAPQFAKSDYAYLFEWDEYLTPRALYQILDSELRAKVATIPLVLNEQSYDVGTILVPVVGQSMSSDEIYEMMQQVASENRLSISAVGTGLSPVGIDLGSSYFETLRMPKIALLVDGGVSSYDAGEVWHLLDQRYDIPITKLPVDEVGRADLSRYNVIIMVTGNYGGISSNGEAQLKQWSRNGGTIIGMKGAVQWLVTKGMAKVTFKDVSADNDATRPYAKLESDRGSYAIGGAIFESTIDLSHPLFYGYNDERLPVFRRNTLFFEPAENPYASPATYTDTPLISGYLKKDYLEKVKNTATVIVSGNGAGRVICLADNPNFRAFWYGTNKLFANAIFFGNTISSRGVER